VPSRNLSVDKAAMAAAFGDRVRARRVEMGLTQEALAHQAQISRNQIQNIEHSRNNNRDAGGRRTGGTGNPRLDTIWALADALEVSVAWLVAGD